MGYRGSRRTASQKASRPEDNASPKLSNFSAVSDIMDRLKVAKSVRNHLKNIDLWAQWTSIVGPELSRVTSPKEVKAKTLVITVAHQAWAHQLHFLSPSILNKIRSVCPHLLIDELYFTVGTVTPKITNLPSAKQRLTAADKAPAKQTPLSERQEMTLRAISDEKLRLAIREAMKAELRYRLSE